MFTLGYLGDPDSLNPDQKTRDLAARKRKPLFELVFAASGAARLSNAGP